MEFRYAKIAAMKRNIYIIAALFLVAFLGWRLVRPMQIFVISPAFELPINTSLAPVMFPTLSAKECAECHREIYDEWRTTIHSQAWTDPYFQVDWKFDGEQQICKNCHIPLDQQQEFLVTGFKDKEKWKPILKPNPEFDEKLQHEGVTCNVCHLHDGKILGVLNSANAPHPVEQLKNANQICVRCHVVSGKRWDTFFKMPPCGTVAEIKSSHDEPVAETVEEMSIEYIASLQCVECHMPVVERPVADGKLAKKVRRHLWRGGHDPDTVKQGLTIHFQQVTNSESNNSNFAISLTNTGAAHYLPTGTPDRHLTVHLRALDKEGAVVKETHYTLKRTVMWRPFIVDLWDTRLSVDKQRQYSFEVNNTGEIAFVEAEVRYHLLDEARRKRIGYNNQTPVNYSVFQKRLPLTYVSHQ